MKHHCADLLASFETNAEAIPELSGRLEEVSVDASQWIAIFRCTQCNQYWKEYYVPTGHGEAPRTIKIAAPQQGSCGFRNGAKQDYDAGPE
jgi:hypothetical protein